MHRRDERAAAPGRPAALTYRRRPPPRRSTRDGRRTGGSPPPAPPAGERDDVIDQLNPDDYATWPTTLRLLRLWREQWRLVVLGLACAVGYTAISLTIPILIARTIDHAIVRHDRPLWEYLLPILVLAAIRFGINFTRRYATARVGVRVEARMRELLYGAYLRFPRAFYDRHPTGQVVSRATNDLYPIRYFIGWGMVQGAQSVMMIVGAGILLLVVNPLLAIYTAIS